MPPNPLFGRWLWHDKDVEMKDDTPTSDVLMQPMARGRIQTSTHPLGDPSTEQTPLPLPLPLPLPRPRPLPLPLPLPLPSSPLPPSAQTPPMALPATVAPAPIPSPAPRSMTTITSQTAFTFSRPKPHLHSRPTKPLKRTTKALDLEGDGYGHSPGLNPYIEGDQVKSQVDKTRIVEQQGMTTRAIISRLEEQDVATRAVVNQKDQQIKELEAQVKDYKTQLEQFMKRMNELEQKLTSGAHASQATPPVDMNTSTPTCSTRMEPACSTSTSHPLINATLRTENTTLNPEVDMNTSTTTSSLPDMDPLPSNPISNPPTNINPSISTSRPPIDMDSESIATGTPGPPKPPFNGLTVMPTTQTMSNTDKGKQKQRGDIFDDDHEMDNISEDDNDSDRTGDEGDGDPQESEDDEAPSPTGKQSVPKPILHFQRPRGGAGPRLKFDSSKPSNPSANINPPTNTHRDIPTLVQHSLGMTSEQIAAIVQVVMTVQGQKPATPPRSKKKNVTGTIVEPSNRQRNARSTELVTAIRGHMNRLLGIRNDNDIRKVKQPQRAVVMAYEEGLEDGPKLVPMQLALAFKKKEPWNVRLAEMFFEDFMEQNERKMGITEDEAHLIYDKFWQRFSNLKKQWKSWQQKEGEDEKDVEHRNLDKKKKARKATRRDSRRNQLSSQRVQIAEGNMTKSDGKTDEVWHFLYVVATSLGQGGASSDESSVEAGGGRKYIINSVEWRSKELIPYLQIIDRDFNRFNRYGNARPGNPSRERTRLAGAKASIRAAIKGLPINFYDATWLANLTNEERNFLAPKAKMDFPTIIEYND